MALSFLVGPNGVERVREILDLPDYVFPVFGMAVGEPADDENGAAKPRLPFDHVFHHNKYHADKRNTVCTNGRLLTRQSASTMINVQTGIAKKHGRSKLRCS